MNTPPRPIKRITLKDVALEAGVSIQTASHVLSGNPTVRLPESTRAKVRQAAEKVGYQPNRHAQAMRSGKSDVVSIWMNIDRPLGNYAPHLRHLTAQARTTGHELMVNLLSKEDALGESGKPPATVWPVDGIISLDAGKAIQAFRTSPASLATPVCVLGFEQVPNGDAVAWNLAEAAEDATKRLIASGAKDIVHVTLDWILQDFPRDQRRRGYTKAMQDAGLEPRFLPVPAENLTETRKAFDEYHARHKVDAAFCYTDTIALGVGRALILRGVPVPDEVQFVGVGDFPEGADFIVPLTTIVAPHQAIIAQAWEWLTQRIKDPTIPPRFTVLPMDYIPRASTREPWSPAS